MELVIDATMIVLSLLFLVCIASILQEIFEEKMNKKVYCKSRYGDIRHIRTVKENVVQITGKSEFIRASQHPDNTDELGMFDFEGGPCFFIGETMFNSNDGKHDFNGMIIEKLTQIVGKECGVEIHLRKKVGK